MYKIFFGDRYITLAEPGQYPVKEQGDAYLFVGKKDLKELISDFSGREAPGNIQLVHDDLEELRAAVRSCFRCIDAGGGLVFNYSGDFLAIERNGMWDLPKGKLDEGEDFETAALREVVEETGLLGVERKHLLCSTYHTYPLKNSLVLKETRWYEMVYSGREKPVLQEEEGITDYLWVDPADTDFVRDRTYASIRDVLNLRFPPVNA